MLSTESVEHNFVVVKIVLLYLKVYSSGIGLGLDLDYYLCYCNLTWT